jgi:cytoskeleton-associated protein 5
MLSISHDTSFNRTYESTPPSAHHIQQPRVPSGPFGLNSDVIADIEKDWRRCEQIKLSQFSPIDLAFADQPIQIMSCNGVTYPTDRLNQLLSKSPSRPHSANVTMYSASSPHRPATASMVRPSTAPEPPLPNLMENLPKYDTKLLNIIKGIGHPDQYVSHASLNELSDIVESQEKQAVLRDYEEIYVQSVLAQFKVVCLFTSHV